MNKDYIILDIGKIIVTFENEEIKYFKDIDNKLETLSEEELNYVKDFFTTKDGYYYSKQLLEVLKSNDNLIDKENLYALLKYLEDIMPERSKGQFYRNIGTLNISIISNEDIFNKKERIFIAARYDSINNNLEIFTQYLSHLRERCKQFDNPEEIYKRELNSILVHELAHVASTQYLKTKHTVYCGFNKHPATKESQKNHGLTEGMTQLIAMNSMRADDYSTSSYYVETCFVNQLINLIGKDVIIESYFANKGTLLIESKLQQIIKDKHLSSKLFRLIEHNYFARIGDYTQTFTGKAQSILLDYFEKKLDILRDSGKYTKEDFDNYIYHFENSLVKISGLAKRNKKIKNYIGLLESIEKFYEIKTKHNELIRTSKSLN